MRIPDVGARVQLGAYGLRGTVTGHAVNGWPLVQWDGGLFCRADPSELIAEPCPIVEASPDEAREILRELHEVTSTDLPLVDDVPFSLQAPVSRGARAVQRGLFDVAS